LQHDQTLIGKVAKETNPKNPLNTIYDAKRLIGNKFSKDTVKEDMKTWLFNVDKDENDKPMIHVKIEKEKN